jgi:hypothetical protein
LRCSFDDDVMHRQHSTAAAAAAAAAAALLHFMHATSSSGGGGGGDNGAPSFLSFRFSPQRSSGLNPRLLPLQPRFNSTYTCFCALMRKAGEGSFAPTATAAAKAVRQRTQVHPIISF